MEKSSAGGWSRVKNLLTKKPSVGAEGTRPTDLKELIKPTTAHGGRRRPSAFLSLVDEVQKQVRMLRLMT